jgi:hypothetical protein
MQVTSRASFHFPFIFQLKAPANLLFAALRLIRFALETAQFFSARRTWRRAAWIV